VWRELKKNYWCMYFSSNTNF